MLRKILMCLERVTVSTILVMSPINLNDMVFQGSSCYEVPYTKPPNFLFRRSWLTLMPQNACPPITSPLKLSSCCSAYSLRILSLLLSLSRVSHSRRAALLSFCRSSICFLNFVASSSSCVNFLFAAGSIGGKALPPGTTVGRDAR